MNAWDLARADAGELDVGALDEAEGVVELDPVGVALLAPRAGSQEGQRRGGPEHDGDADHAPHGPGGTWDGSQGKPAGGLKARVALGRARAAVVLAGDGGGAELRAAQRRAEQLQVAVDVGGGVDVRPALLAAPSAS